MTGFINYLNLPLDPRLRDLLEAWERLRPAPDLLPAYDAAAEAAFAPARDHLCSVAIRHEAGRRRPRYFFVRDGQQTAAELGFDLTGRYLDEVSEMPEFQTMLESDYDIVRQSGKPRSYAEEHHLDNMLRRIVGIQFPFAADGRTVDHILEVTYRIDLGQEKP
jgi:hypothetical protein